MSIGSRIKEARTAAGITQASLAEKIGVTKGAIANYENEVSIPKVDLLYRLMSELSVDANYLYQDDMQPSPAALSPEQQEYLNRYFALSHEGRGRVHAMINYEYAKQREEKKAVVEVAHNTIEFPQETVVLLEPSLPVCAGMGNYLDDNIEWEERTVLKNKYTYGADYIVKLQGDSMEPEFHDGDRLIVTDARGQHPINGRVGIFIINGDAFFRQPLADILHPYNPKYKDIIPIESDDVKYVGYVVGIIDDSWIINNHEAG